MAEVSCRGCVGSPHPGLRIVSSGHPWNLVMGYENCPACNPATPDNQVSIVREEAVALKRRLDPH